MTQSYRNGQLALYDNRGNWKFLTFPFLTPQQDPGSGAGGSESICVRQGGVFKIAWTTALLGGVVPPSGWNGQPAGLTGNEDWWPHGFHNYGRVGFSPNFGYVATINGLRQNGTVGGIHACYRHGVDINPNRTWKYMAPLSQSGGEGGANAWSYYWGFDYALRKDLVVMGDGGDIRLTLRSISGSFGSVATLGPVVWQGSDADFNAGYSFFLMKDGDDRVNIPWRNEWWVIQLTQAGGLNRIWGFNTLTGVRFDVPIPAAVLARIQTYPGNLAISADHVTQRIIAAQADVTQSPVSERYPLLLWEIQAASPYTWTPISLASTLRVYPPADNNGVNPLIWSGGFRWKYMDPLTDDTNAFASVSGSSGLRYSSGGYTWKDIFIPKASPPRTIAITERKYASSGVAPGGVMQQKHVEYCQRGNNGRIYWHGGDMNSAPYAGGQHSVCSFNPEDPTSLQIHLPAIISGKPVRPLRPDENGFQYRAASDDFWMHYMYQFPNDTGFSDYESLAEWESICGGNQTGTVWRLNLNTLLWTVTHYTPSPGWEGQTIAQGDGHGGRWYHDPTADTMVAIGFNVGTGSSISVVKCSDLTFKKYSARRLADGSTIIGGRNLSLVHPNWDHFCGDDRACMDPATGNLYFWNPYTGDVYRCETRGTPYQVSTTWYLPIYWCCRIPPCYLSRNLTHFAFAKGAVWIVTERGRIFSWALGESYATEHPTPLYFGATAMCKYSVNGDERLFCIGGQSVYNSTSRNTAISSKWDYWYTITIA